ncbi:Polycomb group protein [Salix suchowensis]|nr:Polycomb group protein [Salix suchowensis]
MTQTNQNRVLRPPPLHPISGAVPMSLQNPHPPRPPPPSPPEEQVEYLPPIRKQHHRLLGASPLYKQHSWSPDIYRDEAWLKRKDLDELKGCIELGFGFDSPEVDPRLSDTFPALELYYAVNKNYFDHSASKPVVTATPSSSTASDCDSPSPLGSPHTIFGPGENPQTVKTRLRQWAQVLLVRCVKVQVQADHM